MYAGREPSLDTQLSLGPWWRVGVQLRLSLSRSQAEPGVQWLGQGCRKAGGGKSEAGAVLSSQAQVWRDKFIKWCLLPTVSMEQGPPGGRRLPADSAFQVLSGAWWPREREKGSRRERERVPTTSPQRKSQGGRGLWGSLWGPPHPSCGSIHSWERAPVWARGEDPVSPCHSLQTTEWGPCFPAHLKGQKKTSPFLEGSTPRTHEGVSEKAFLHIHPTPAFPLPAPVVSLLI